MYSYEVLMAYDEYCFEIWACEGRAPVSLERWLEGEE